MAVVEEEADESLYWMDLLVESSLVKRELLTDLMVEGNELVAIAAASVMTARSHIQQSAIRSQK